MSGFKSRNIISAIYDRFKVAKNPVSKERSVLGESEERVKRWLTKAPPVWLLIDDVDLNFRNTPEYKIKIASFFIAARQLATEIPQLRMRLAVRPNVWAILKLEFEALSHVEQYCIQLEWSEAQIRHLLASRIGAHLRRRGLSENEITGMKFSPEDSDKALIELAFVAPMEWGRNKATRQPRLRPPHVVLYTLSRARPRWVVELAKEAARAARSIGASRILLAHITGELEAFGQKRIEDTVAEFSPQCPEIRDLISAFAGQSEEFSTADLMTTISKRVLSSINPRIDGVVGDAEARDVAAFLYQIGFLSARRDYDDGTYDHYAFKDKPNLLRSRTNLDEGVRWEIHPVFRQVLALRDSRGQQIRGNARAKRRRGK